MNLLGEFLKSRRGRLRAEDFGLTTHGRRRVPGLRREELARLAGLSAPYLTRLEQGIDRNPSPQVLQALAAALRLDREEIAHLWALAVPPPAAEAHPGVSDEVQELLDSWTAAAAYVRNRRFDVLAANKVALALGSLYTPGRNLVRDMFLDPRTRTLFVDWPEVAAQTVAALRAEADPHDPATAALVSALLPDPDFAALWSQHDVRPTRHEAKRFQHPVAGRLTLRRQALTIAGAEDQVIITYQGLPAEALERLL